MLFRIHRRLEYGSSLYLTGSTPALSNWSVKEALLCHWADNDIWTLQTNPLLPSSSSSSLTLSPTRFEFKLFSGNSSREHVLWEHGENHSVVLTVPSLSTYYDLQNIIIDVTWASTHEFIITPTPLTTSNTSSGVSSPLEISLLSPPPTPVHFRKSSGNGNHSISTVVNNGHDQNRNADADANVGVIYPESAHQSDALVAVSAAVAAVAANTNGKDTNTNGTAVKYKKRDKEEEGKEEGKKKFLIITLRIKYHVKEGERIYIVGSIPSLGSWNKMHSPMLQLNHQQKDIHELQTRIPLTVKTFEYKYFTRRSDGTRRWESGENRIGKPSSTPRGELIWDDRWEKVAVEFSIYYPGDNVNDEVMYITGDIEQIGAWYKPGPTEMKLGPLQMLETDVKGKKWILKVWIDSNQSDFSYRYILINKKSKFELWEREPNRKTDFIKYIEENGIAPSSSKSSSSLPSHYSTTTTKTTSTSTSSTSSSSSSIVTKVLVNSIYEMKDLNFVSEMKFDAVPEKMFIGPYPQSEEDVIALAKGGVTAVLNVQTDEDFEHRGIQWNKLLKAYKENNIKIVRYQIRDFDRDSLKKHLRGAAHALNDLIHQDGLDVYIHCTAGMGRAPAVAVAYLCWVKGMDLMDAVKHVKKYRTVAVPNVPVLEQALKLAF